ncbi:MATE family efflux transporter [Isachenkonia alkalipeptolytica]|nr:MATE family efflux transporter [Isachenkonia alkalipeptolytica]
MKKTHVKGLLIIALPLMIQNTLRGLLGSVDKLFVGQLGEQAIAGVGGSNQLFSLFLTIFMAISAGLSILLSQYLGGKKIHKFGKLFSTMLSTGLMIGVLVTVLFRFRGEVFLTWLNISGGALEEATAYFSVIALSTTLLLLSASFSGVFLALKKNTYPMVATFISMGINTMLNAYFIFVLEWGVTGVAYATLISRALEFGILLFLVKGYLRKLNIPFRPGFDPLLFKVLVSISVPMALDGAAWQLAMTVYTRIIFTIGVQEVAVYEILKIFQTITLTAISAMAAANVGIVGAELGGGAFQRAKEKANAGILTAFIVATGLNIIIFTFSREIFSLFNLEETTLNMGLRAVPLVLIIIYTQILNVIFPYILRSGGDTWANLWITIFGFWALQIPLAWLLGIRLEMGIQGVLYSMLVAEGVKGTLFYLRYRQGNWLKNLAREN